jgi:GntR family transcriptional regulator/MocR family aminotransferase
MVKRRAAIPLQPFRLHANATRPLHRQLYGQIRSAILNKVLPGGSRLPSTRTLAEGLGVSRTTVLAAFDQLSAEGYLHSAVGSGTFVTNAVPANVGEPAAPLRGAAGARTAGPLLSRQGERIAGSATTGFRQDRSPRPFQPGVPAIDRFPIAVWGRLLARRWESIPDALFGYHDPAGYWPLREAIAGYLREARMMRCDADQIVIVAGSQQALFLIAHLLTDPGDVVWMEDPGYGGARVAFLSAGATVVPVSVDEEGFALDSVAGTTPAARLVYVTPSHQFPLGMTMSLRRRLALIEWAARTSAWVIEDDYSSEYRYAGKPLAAMQGLDRAGRVIYLGTFSKVLFPAMRIGYLVAPPALIDAFRATRALLDRGSPTLTQAVLADFIDEGHFGRHIRRMRTLYADRQAAILDACAKELRSLLDVSPSDAGMHVVGWLPERCDDQAVSARAAARGVPAPPLSAYSILPPRRGALILGYTCARPRALRAAARQLRGAISESVARGARATK